MPSDRRRLCLDLFARNILIGASTLSLLATLAFSQDSVNLSAGIAWNVKGSWQVEDKGPRILTGDAVRAGSLLTPATAQAGTETVSNSITVLLPDGQLLLFECFTTDDCSRGFRVPSLFRTPDPQAVDMLARIRQGLAGDPDLFADAAKPPHARLPRDEAVATLGPDNRVRIEGLAARLSNGHYTYDVRPLDRAHPREFRLPIEKVGPSISLALPSPGLYFVKITDSLDTPRIDLFVAAVEPARASSIEKSYRDAAALMKDWNTYYLGWPIHEFQRAYLEAVVMGVNASSTDRRTDAAGGIASHDGSPERLADRTADRTGLTAEPAFTPRPGLFEKDVAITLQCKTPGAAIHFTVDGSQPVASSPVYSGPIMMKGGVLTVKSFASVSKKKDSPVVTGIFRIRE